MKECEKYSIQEGLDIADYTNYIEALSDLAKQRLRANREGDWELKPFPKKWRWIRRLLEKRDIYHSFEAEDGEDYRTKTEARVATEKFCKPW